MTEVAASAAAPGASSALAQGQTSRIVSGLTSYFFYGWVIVAMGFIAQMLTSLSIQGLSTYVGPLEREFGWSASATAAGRSFQQADSFLGPLNGWLVDRFGPRKLMTAGVVLYMVSFIMFSQVDSLPAFYAACLLMALSNSLVGLLVVSFSINRWFRRKRTTAMGLAVMGLAAAGVVFIPLVVWAQSRYGWRTAALSTGVGMLILGLPIMLLMRDTPERYGLLPDGDRPGQTETAAASRHAGGLVDFTLRQALSTRAFWLITIGTALANLAQSGIIVHQFPHMEELLTRETAAFVLSEINIFNMAGRLFGGMLGDRMPKNVLMGTNLLGATTGLAILAVASTVPLFLLYGAFFGFSWGVRTAVSNSLQGDYFGRAAFGKIAGLTQTLASPAAIVAPVLVGLGVDRLGGYQTPFLVLAVISGIASLLFFVAHRPPVPVLVRGPVGQ